VTLSFSKKKKETVYSKNQLHVPFSYIRYMPYASDTERTSRVPKETCENSLAWHANVSDAPLLLHMKAKAL